MPVLANIIGDVFNAFLNLLGFIMAFFYRFIPSIGISIILLTVVLRLIVWPLTAKQARSMLAMQRAQPEIKKLQAKYKDDRTKLNEEMMKFYKENEINPFGGCLPLVLQMPIFIGLYRLLNNIPKHIPKTGAFSSMYTAICDSAGAKCFASPSSYKLPFFPNGMFDLHLSAGGEGHLTGLSVAPYWILVVLVVVSAYAQQKQTMRYQTQANAQMQMVGRIMPLFFAFISIRIPAGVVLYFFVSNLWQIGQQEVVYRRIGTPTGEPVGKKAKAKHVEAKSREVTEQPSIEAAPDTGGGKPASAGNGKAAPNGGREPDPKRQQRRKRKK